MSARRGPGQPIANIEARKHLNDPIVGALRLLGKDAVTNEFGDDDHRRTPDPARPLARDGNTLQLVIVAELLAILIAIGDRRATRRSRQYSVFDYTATTFSFLGLATPVFWLALMLQVLVREHLLVDRHTHLLLSRT